MALITYCQKELGSISKMSTELEYHEEITIVYDAESLSDKSNPLGIEKSRIISKIKQADIDNLAY
jgi:hypothetical protein